MPERKLLVDGSTLIKIDTSEKSLSNLIGGLQRAGMAVEELADEAFAEAKRNQERQDYTLAQNQRRNERSG